MISARNKLALVLLLLVPSHTRAQDPPPATGNVAGFIQTPDGQPAGGVVVTLQQNAQKMRDAIQATTDAQGKFELKDVPEGKYNLNARTSDAKGKAIKSVTVVADKTTDVGVLKLKMK